MTDINEIRSALSHIPADDRGEWVLLAMAVKSELGEEGFDLWDGWSQRADSYRPRDARAVWRSVKPHGGTTIRTLFALAIRYGWQPASPEQPQQPQALRVRSQESIDAERKDRERRRLAATEAADIIRKCQAGSHPYLAGKGFPDEQVLLDYDGRLVVPMRDAAAYSKVNSLQWISADGTKKFLTGGTAKGSVFMLGSGSETWLVEGYATGLSVREALKRLYRPARVAVCFSAGNLKAVAAILGRAHAVVADHDKNGVGAAAAAATGLPWVMPPVQGQDANDLHQTAGLDALVNLLREALIR